jgi:hypothetical protein
MGRKIVKLQKALSETKLNVAWKWKWGKEKWLNTTILNWKIIKKGIYRGVEHHEWERHLKFEALSLYAEGILSSYIILKMSGINS